MPLYEYRCADCSHLTEVLQRLGGGADGLSCPACGSDRLERQLSTFAGRSGSGASGAEASAACSGPT